MVHKTRKKTFYIVTAVILAIVLGVTIVLVANLLSSGTKEKADSPKSTDTSKISNETPLDDTNSDIKTETPSVPKDTTDVDTINPEQVSTIAIDPMLISVSYMKGIEGFDFQVLRNPNGTNYVQFSAPKLVGTKCTNDVGVFASIIESPTADEAATLTKTIETDGTTYGLSLTDATCTADASLLKQYQDSFSVPFSLLKKI